MQKLETSSKIMNLRGNSFTKVNKIMKRFTTESLWQKHIQFNKVSEKFTEEQPHKLHSLQRHFLWLWEPKSWKAAKLGECFTNQHSIPTLGGSYTSTLSQAAFLNHAGVCST